MSLAGIGDAGLQKVRMGGSVDAGGAGVGDRAALEVSIALRLLSVLESDVVVVLLLEGVQHVVDGAGDTQVGLDLFLGELAESEAHDELLQRDGVVREEGELGLALRALQQEVRRQVEFLRDNVGEHLRLDGVDFRRVGVLAHRFSGLAQRLADQREELVLYAVVCPAREAVGDDLPVAACRAVQLQQSHVVFLLPLFEVRPRLRAQRRLPAFAVGSQRLSRVNLQVVWE